MKTFDDFRADNISFGVLYGIPIRRRAEETRLDRPAARREWSRWRRCSRSKLQLEQRRKGFTGFLHLRNGVDDDIRMSGMPLHEVLMRLLGGEEPR